VNEYTARPPANLTLTSAAGAAEHHDASALHLRLDRTTVQLALVDGAFRWLQLS
jgi:hypothetical protein